MTFDQAMSLCRERQLAGVGFVMSKDDDLVGVDLDNAITEDGMVKQWAWDIVRELGSYCELSPSGRGLHVWVRGKLPAGGSRIKVEDGLLEVYDQARYFTVTGKHLDKTPGDIFDWGNLGEWYFYRFPSKPPPVEEPRPFNSDDIEDWIQDALDHIPADDYEVWTSVGMALKSEFGESAFELWRQWSMHSTKYGGDDVTWRKWQSFRGEGYTIGTVIEYAKQNGFERPRVNADDIFPGTNDYWDNYGKEEDSEDIDKLLWTATELYALEERREYVIEPNIAGAGDKIVMAGPPKSMKSFLLIDMLAHFSRGEPWRCMAPARPLKCLVFNLEIHHEAMSDRLDKLAQKANGNLVFTKRLVGRPPTQTLQKIVDRCGGFDIVVVDPLANWFSGESENDNAEMMDELGKLDELRGAIGEDTILWLIHHTRKVTQKEMKSDPFNAFRGASSLRGYYDTGLAVWRDQESKEIELCFELRNGEAPETEKLLFKQGGFEEVKEDSEPKYLWFTKLEAFMHKVGGKRAANAWGILLEEEFPNDVVADTWRKRIAKLKGSEKEGLEGFIL